MTKKLSEALRSGEQVFGAWISTPDPSIVEVMSQTGYDFLLFDGEHTPIRPHDLRYLLPITERLNAPVMYRPGTHSEGDIKTALDSGVDALLVPMVESVDQARKIVNAAKYQPVGRRGIGPLRAANYYEDFDSYLTNANAQTSLVLQIESRAGVSAAKEIAAIDGVDGLYVGPADLASDAGLPIGEMSDGLFVLCEHVAEAAKASGKPCGIDLASPESIPSLRDLGFTFFTHGQDILLMMSAARAMTETLRSS